LALRLAIRAELQPWTEYFEGSVSIKYVLEPLVPELSYNDLVIVDGLVATRPVDHGGEQPARIDGTGDLLLMQHGVSSRLGEVLRHHIRYCSPAIRETVMAAFVSA